MKLVTIVGTLAAVICTAGFLPQVIKGYITKSVDDVALWQPVLLVSGMTLWLIYGIMLKEMPIIASNIVAIACNIMLLVMKFIYTKKDE